MKRRRAGTEEAEEERGSERLSKKAEDKWRKKRGSRGLKMDGERQPWVTMRHSAVGLRAIGWGQLGETIAITLNRLMGGRG